MSRLAKLRSLLLSAVSFAAFGAITAGLVFVAIPASRLFARAPGSEEVRAQRWIHRGARCFMGLVQRLGVLRLDVSGAERLRDGRAQLVVANHPTIFDLVVLLSLLPQADCIVSGNWAENVFLRRLIAAGGYIRNDAGCAVVRACLRHLRAGRTVIVFPEGTRSPAGGLGAFRAGAAFVALRSGRDLLPVLLTCEPAALTKGQSWYDVPAGSMRVTVRVGQAVPAPPVAQRAGSRSQAARRLTAELREVFVKGLDIADVGTA